MIFCGKTSDYGLVSSTKLPNAFVLYMVDGDQRKWSKQFPPDDYDSAQHIQFSNSYTRIVVALYPFAIVYLNAADGSLIRSYSDYKTIYNNDLGTI